MNRFTTGGKITSGVEHLPRASVTQANIGAGWSGNGMSECAREQTDKHTHTSRADIKRREAQTKAKAHVEMHMGTSL